jgi:hypothetical protein
VRFGKRTPTEHLVISEGGRAHFRVIAPIHTVRESLARWIFVRNVQNSKNRYMDSISNACHGWDLKSDESYRSGR